MPLPREILNELKWRDDRDISKAEIWYVHRGAPNDTKIISGDEIRAFEHSFMVLEEAKIPYHRIFKIVYDDNVIFERKSKR
ncbi:MAG: DUF504 domain-containing protein [Thermoplasmata archaeon]|nr:MAG: DUF504 domain-containing protein [Thermoplasmata archaeon]